MKKEYIQPSMKVVKLQYRSQILTTSDRVTSVSTNLGDDSFIWGEGDDEDAR